MKKSRDASHLPLTASLPYNPRLLTRDVWQTMIKILRFANEKYPWFLAITMGFIAVSFIVGMGWWGFGEHSGSVVATVGDLSISLDEFKRAYENTYRFYKEKVPGEFKDETIKHYVVEQLVDNRVWLIAAHNLRLTVTEDDLRESILQIPEFQRNGRFDPEHYQRLLAANHLTPSMFEATQAKELLSLKARIMVSDAVALTPAELAEAQALTLRQPDSDPAKAAAAKERAVQDVLFQKQQRTLVAYAQSLKATLPITIKRELL
jgi:SurA-like protein